MNNAQKIVVTFDAAMNHRIHSNFWRWLQTHLVFIPEAFTDGTFHVVSLTPEKGRQDESRKQTLADAKFVLSLDIQIFAHNSGTDHEFFESIDEIVLG
jgi:hypothetical protein